MTELDARLGQLLEQRKAKKRFRALKEYDTSARSGLIDFVSIAPSLVRYCCGAVFVKAFAYSGSRNQIKADGSVLQRLPLSINIANTATKLSRSTAELVMCPRLDRISPSVGRY